MSSENTPSYLPPLKIQGPEFEIYLADQNQMRRVRLQRIYAHKIFYVKAVDSADLEPREFFIRDHLPLQKLFDLLATAWDLNQKLPIYLLPAKRIPPEILQNLKELDPSQSWILYEELCKRGFFTNLLELKKGNQPKHIQWSQIPSLCLKTKLEP